MHRRMNSVFSVKKRSLSAPLEWTRTENIRMKELEEDLIFLAQELRKEQKKKEMDKEEEIVDEYENDDDKGYVRVKVKSDHEIYVQAEAVEEYPDQQQNEESEGFEDSDTEELEYSDVFEDSDEESNSEETDYEEEIEHLFDELSNITIDENGTEEQKNMEDERMSPYETLYLPVIHEKHKTGFEDTKDFPITISSIIAGRYQVQEYLGSAAFSRAVQCLDLKTNELVCIKIIKNNKDFFDQSLDEIKLLRYINTNGDPDEYNVVKLYDFFYFKEHLFLVCELLGDNLYEFSKYNRESGEELYFTIPRLQRITKQVLVGLAYIHSLGLVHCDLKPENILMRSYSRCLVKIIDFGSSCFLTDQLCHYVQSRTYRAPEVVLGLKYDQKVDIWSLGCILAELWTGQVLFANKSIQTMLAKTIGLCGEFPKDMMESGQFTPKFFTKDSHLFEKNRKNGKITFLIPKKISLESRLKSTDKLFVDFVRQCLQIDPRKRATVDELLQHPWILCKDYPSVVSEELENL